MVMMPLPMKALMTVAMMVGMMLPSIAPAVWHYHRRLRAMHIPLAAHRTMLLTLGYASLWAVIGQVLLVVSGGLSPIGMAPPTAPLLPPWVAGAVMLCAGLIQRSRWKATRLLRCRQACVPTQLHSRNLLTALTDGSRLGVACGLSCAAPMAVLLVGGLMDARMMVVITAAITAERVTPDGARIARITGALALVAGFVMCLRAIRVSMPL